MTPDPTRTFAPDTGSFDPILDAGLAAAFGPDPTPGGWSRPPLLRDDPSDHAPVVQPASPEMPRTPPKDYQVYGVIARGGMGVIFKGRDPNLGREVAFKVLKSDLAGKQSAEQRFVEEAQVGGQLQHPGLVPVYELGRFDDGRPYFTMKLVKGRTLADLLADRPDPTADRGTYLRHFLKVCETVAYAHNRGVIHRDLKPANVMVGNFGEVQVMDWGLAKVLARGGDEERTVPPNALENEPTRIRTVRSGAGAETQAGSVFGTPSFMPPEQAGGEIDKLDERADVFGLGAVLCVILTGQPPFVGTDPEAVRLMAIRGQLDGAFARLGGCGDAELAKLCKRCLAPQREGRPRHAGEVKEAVAAYLSGVEERARRAEVERAAAVVKAAEERKRRKVQAALGLATAAVVGLVGFGLWWADRAATTRNRERLAARDVARLNLKVALDRAAAAYREDRLPDADAALDRAADLLTTAAAAELGDRYESLRADRATFAELDRVWAKANAVINDQAPGPPRPAGGLRFDTEAARRGYPAVLAARGLTVGSGDPGELAARIQQSPIRDRLVAALDDWLPVAAAEDRARLCDLLARADPDPARNEIRKASIEPDRLRTLFARPPAPSALKIAARAAIAPQVPPDQALAVLQAAVVQEPADFRTQYSAGLRALRSDPVTAAGHFRAAVALRPDNMAAVHGLGSALHQTGKWREAAPLFLRAVELDPGFGSAYINLADAIRLGADPTAAVAHFEREVVRDPNQPLAHFGLGMALRDSRRAADRQRAVAAFRRSIELDDSSALAHNYLGYVSARVDDRIRCFQLAIERDPTFAFPHYNLAGGLRQKRDVPGAVAEYRKAIELFPEHTFSHRDLASALAVLGKWDEAEKEYRILCKLLPNNPTGYPGLIDSLARQGKDVAAVAVFEDLVRRNQSWALDPRTEVRYGAAYAAARAGTGQGRDTLSPDARAGYRRQALDWLRADLTAYRRGFAPDPNFAPVATDKVMQHWLTDPDLSLVRNPIAVGLLPADERVGWKALWADVRRLRDEAAPAR